MLRLIGLLRAQGFDWDTWVGSSEEAPFNDTKYLPSPPAVKPTSSCEPGVNLYGGDLKVAAGAKATAVACAAACKAAAGCVAYVFQTCNTTGSAAAAAAAAADGDDDIDATIGRGAHMGLGGGSSSRTPQNSAALAKPPSCFLKSGGWKVEKGDPMNPGCHLCSQILGPPPPQKPPPGLHPWFPTNAADADQICRDEWLPYVDRQWTHGVNLMQAAYLWGLEHRLAPTKGWLRRGRAMWDKIYKYHGLPTGVPSGDECLAGDSPSRGTETCTVVETMMSLGEMYAISGDISPGRVCHLDR